MTEPLFKIGDVVALKSGGPPMTVEMIDHNVHQGQPSKPMGTMYHAIWFRDRVTMRDAFLEPELVPYPSYLDAIEQTARQLASNIYAEWEPLASETKETFRKVGTALVTMIMCTLEGTIGDKK